MTTERTTLKSVAVRVRGLIVRLFLVITGTIIGLGVSCGAQLIYKPTAQSLMRSAEGSWQIGGRYHAGLDVAWLIIMGGIYAIHVTTVGWSAFRTAKGFVPKRKAIDIVATWIAFIFLILPRVALPSDAFFTGSELQEFAHTDTRRFYGYLVVWIFDHITSYTFLPPPAPFWGLFTVALDSIGYIFITVRGLDFERYEKN